MYASGKLASKNIYCLAGESAGYRALARLPAIAMNMVAHAMQTDGETILTFELTNNGQVASLANKLTLFGADKQRVLPAYFSDNYISLLPGESQTVQIAFPSGDRGQGEIALRGWNAMPQTLPVSWKR